jgi:methyl-accepting chemotaxis protein
MISILLIAALVLSMAWPFYHPFHHRPGGQGLGLAETMAKGDFTAKFDINQKDEIGLMAASLNTMVTQFSAMIRDIIGGVNRPDRLLQ